MEGMPPKKVRPLTGVREIIEMARCTTTRRPGGCGKATVAESGEEEV
jgi:hypothetical protein